MADNDEKWFLSITLEKETDSKKNGVMIINITPRFYVTKVGIRQQKIGWHIVKGDQKETIRTHMQIPLSLAIVPDDVKEFLPSDHSLPDSYKTIVSFVLFLWAEKQKGKASKWVDYITTIPFDALYHPFLWTDEQKNEIRGTACYDHMMKEFRLWDTFYTRSDLIKTIPYSNFIALVVYVNIQFTMHSKPRLMPYVDTINWGERDVKNEDKEPYLVTLKEVNGFLEVQSLVPRAIRSGEEMQFAESVVCPNEVWFTILGYVPENNTIMSHAKIIVPMEPLNERNATEQYKRKMYLPNMNTSFLLKIPYHPDGENELFSHLRLVHANHEELALISSFQRGCKLTFPPVSLRNEALVLTQLKRLLENTPRPPEYDADQKVLPSWKRQCERIQTTEHQIKTFYRVLCQEMLNILFAPPVLYAARVLTPAFKMFRSYAASLGPLQMAYQEIDTNIRGVPSEIRNIKSDRYNIMKTTQCMDLPNEDTLSRMNRAAFEERKRMDEFHYWCINIGIQFGPMYLRYYPTPTRYGYCHSHGYHALTVMDSDETLMEIPSSCIIHSEHVRTTTPFISEYKDAKEDNEQINRYVILTLWLLDQLAPQENKNENDKGKWDDYIRSLPKQMNHVGILFSEDDLKWLDKTTAVEHIKHVRQSFLYEYKLVKTHAPHLASQISLTDYLSVRAYVNSRAFPSQDTKGAVLVPILDTFNHAPIEEANSEWKWKDNKLVVRSTRPIQYDDELKICFGHKSNFRFLTFYGFTEQDNPLYDETVDMVFTIPKSATVPFIQNVTIPNFNICSSGFHDNPNDSDDEVDDEKDEQHKTNGNEKEFRYNLHILRHAVDGKNFPKIVDPMKCTSLSLDNEMRMLTLISNQATIKLMSFSSTIEEDSQLLSNSTLTLNQRNCVIVRRAEKRLLQKMAQYAVVLLPLCVDKDPLQASNQYMISKDADPYIIWYIEKFILPLVKRGDKMSLSTETTITNDSKDSTITKMDQKEEAPKQKTPDKISERTITRDCLICLSSPACNLVFPCLHLCMCDTCATLSKQKSVATCPVCRSTVLSIKPIY